MDFAAEVRARDRTAFLGTLFAPEAVRPALLALAAYRLECRRIVETVSDPMAAEIRLQWWRDAIRNQGYGEGGGVPLVEALREGILQYGWPADALCSVSEAHIHDLYADPFETWDDFDGYAGEGFGTPVQLAAMALCVHALGDQMGQAAARTAATAAGYAGVAEAAADAALYFVPRFLRARTGVPAAAFREATGREVREALERGKVPETAAGAVQALVEHGAWADGEMRAALPSVAAEAKAAFLPALAARASLEAVRRAPLSPRAPGALKVQWTLWREARRLAKG
jgi:phytoene synthase